MKLWLFNTSFMTYEGPFYSRDEAENKAGIYNGGKGGRWVVITDAKKEQANRAAEDAEAVRVLLISRGLNDSVSERIRQTVDRMIRLDMEGYVS